MQAGADSAAQTAFTPAQLLYVWLAALMASCLLIADIVGVKGFKLGSVEHTCGMLTFPVTFLVTDLVNEYYGKRAARRLTYIALAMGALAFLVINIALPMPYAPWSPAREPAFREVFASARIMYMASLAAYLAGQLFDIYVFGWMKRLTGGRFIWLRATGSTVVSQMLDSLVVSTLFLKGIELTGGAVATPAAILKMAGTGYVLKFFLAVGVTPLLYVGRWVVQRQLGLVPLPPEEKAPGH